jgi:hypothetical protein
MPQMRARLEVGYGGICASPNTRTHKPRIGYGTQVKSRTLSHSTRTRYRSMSHHLTSHHITAQQTTPHALVTYIPKEAKHPHPYPTARRRKIASNSTNLLIGVIVLSRIWSSQREGGEEPLRSWIPHDPLLGGMTAKDQMSKWTTAPVSDVHRSSQGIGIRGH